MKVVNDLSRQGVIATTRGRGGGLRLLQAADTIRIGDIVRSAETDFRLVECFDPTTNVCTLTPNCQLRHVFGNALQAYFRELDGVTLADITQPASPATPSEQKLPIGSAPVHMFTPRSRPQRKS